jgi:carboxypeptidase family protein/peptidase M1-like protein
MRRLVPIFAALAFICAGPVPSWAGTLSGTVADPSGAGAFNALISARNEATGEIVRTKSDDDGRFSIDLPAGAYKVEVALAGFVTVERRVVIEESRPEVLDIKLELAETRSEVNVRGKGATLANSDPNYRALRDAQPKETLAVSNLVLKRDVGVLTLKSGRISFVPPVLDRVTMAAFNGEGEFTLEPAIASERSYLRLITGSETVHETFNRLVLCFTDDTYAEIRRQAEKGPDVPPERDILNDHRRRLRHRPDQPRSLLEYLLTSEEMDNIESDILADLYNPRRPGFFSAYIFGRKHGDLRFHVRPRGALPQLLAPEEVALLNAEPLANDEGIWYLAHLQGEYAGHTASSREDKRVIHIDRYKIETAVSKRDRLTATADLAFTALGEGDRVIKFGLLPNLRVTRVTTGGDREISYIQEKRKEDGSFYVILPEPTVRGRQGKLTIEYEGNKVIEDAGGGNFAVGARTSWYPSVGGFTDRSAFDLTFKVPKQYTLVGVGNLVKEWREGDYAASQWVSENPLAVAGFNYGHFKKKQVTDSVTHYQIEGYATAELPDYLRNVESAGALTPSRLIDNAIVDAQNAIRLYTIYFGEAPYGRIAITQQPQFNFGQSWPTLVYLPISAFFDATQRWMLMGGNAFRFADFIQEVTPHEVAHQWWGHIVGWSSFHDQWLSEGFADFSAGLFLQLMEKKQDKYLKFLELNRKAVTDKNEFGLRPNDAGPLWMGLRLDSRRTAGAYRRLVYPKGGYILHMLRSMMSDPKTGDQAFIAMMHDFVKTYYQQNACTEDFRQIVEKHMTPTMNLDGNGRMDWFFNEWVYGIDVPRYRLDYSLSEEGGKVWLKGTIEQSDVSPQFKMVVPLYLDFDGKPLLVARSMLIGNTTTKEFRVPLPKRPKRVLINAEHDVLAAEVVINGK